MQTVYDMNVYLLEPCYGRVPAAIVPRPCQSSIGVCVGRGWQRWVIGEGKPWVFGLPCHDLQLTHEHIGSP